MSPEQLNKVVAATGHERFRWLVSDANPDEAQRGAYRDTVAMLAEGTVKAVEPPPPTPTFGPEVRKALWLGRLDCLYAGPPDCGCSGSHKCHHLGRDATLGDCVRCLGAR